MATYIILQSFFLKENNEPTRIGSKIILQPPFLFLLVILDTLTVIVFVELHLHICSYIWQTKCLDS